MCLTHLCVGACLCVKERLYSQVFKNLFIKTLESKFWDSPVCMTRVERKHHRHHVSSDPKQELLVPRLGSVLFWVFLSFRFEKKTG